MSTFKLDQSSITALAAAIVEALNGADLPTTGTSAESAPAKADKKADKKAAKKEVEKDGGDLTKDEFLALIEEATEASSKKEVMAVLAGFDCKNPKKADPEEYADIAEELHALIGDDADEDEDEDEDEAADGGKELTKDEFLALVDEAIEASSKKEVAAVLAEFDCKNAKKASPDDYADIAEELSALIGEDEGDDDEGDDDEAITFEDVKAVYDKAKKVDKDEAAEALEEAGLKSIAGAKKLSQDDLADLFDDLEDIAEG